MFSLLKNWKLIAIGLLLVSLTGSAYLLKKSYVETGIQTATVDQLRAVNDETALVLVSEREQFQVLQQEMIARESEYQTISTNLSKARKKLHEIPDESGCLHTDLGRAYWLRITADPNSAPTMPAD